MGLLIVIILLLIVFAKIVLFQSNSISTQKKFLNWACLFWESAMVLS